MFTILVKERQLMLAKLHCICDACVCLREKPKQKRDKSDMKRYSTVEQGSFFDVFLCHNRSLLLLF